MTKPTDHSGARAAGFGALLVLVGLMTVAWLGFAPPAGWGSAWFCVTSGSGLLGGAPSLGLNTADAMLMAAGMMLPTAAPALLVWSRRSQAQMPLRPLSAPFGFAGGYLFPWALVALGIGAVQTFVAIGAPWPGLVVAAVGLYQFSPWKRACLNRCRPGAVPYLGQGGLGGAVSSGARYGISCVGCCGPLMLLPLVAGFMGWAAMIALTALMLGERMLRRGIWMARLAGGALLAWGLAIVVGA